MKALSLIWSILKYAAFTYLLLFWVMHQPFPSKQSINQYNKIINSVTGAFSSEEKVSGATPTLDSSVSAKLRCKDHPVSATRIISASGEKHFTADTGEECE